MEYAFMNFLLETASWDAALTDQTTTNGKLLNESRKQEYQIKYLQEEMCNLKVLT